MRPAPVCAFLVLVCLASVFLSPVVAAQTQTMPFFGPQDFVRSSGAPQAETVEFSVSLTDQTFLLRLENGGTDGTLAPASSALVWLNGEQVVGPRDLNQNVGLLERDVALGAENVLSVEVRGIPGSGFTLTLLGEVPTVDLGIEITSPVTGWVTSNDAVDVAGEFVGVTDRVEVEGVVAVLDGQSFVAYDVPLVEGTNLLTALAFNAFGEPKSDSVSVRRDTAAPYLVVETPSEGERLVSPTVTVQGIVNDVIPGATVNHDDVSVFVDGEPAAVNNRTFLKTGVQLVEGENEIFVEAFDRAGNRSERRVRVSYEPDLPGPRVVVLGGDGQSETIFSPLPVPLRVRVEDASGTALAGRPVTFRVRRGDGALTSKDGGESREIRRLTNALGEAEARFRLGSRTGEGFHRVEVSTVGGLNHPQFCATAEPSAPRQVSVVETPRVRGAVGRPLSKPLAVIVTDDGGNPVPGVPVRFRAERGSGVFEDGSYPGERASWVETNPDGIAQASWRLGSTVGVDVQRAEVTFENNPGRPAVFLASSFALACRPTPPSPASCRTASEGRWRASRWI